MRMKRLLKWEMSPTKLANIIRRHTFIGARLRARLLDISPQDQA
jgi:hypothetical protein